MKTNIKKLRNIICLIIAPLLFNSINIKAESSDENPGKTAKKIKIALLLDTSNSMDGLIEQAKSQLWTLVNELAQAKCDNLKPEVKIALYEYGNDRLSAAEGYIRMVTPLTNDLDKLSEDLFKLTTNGGSEFCGQVIQTAVKQLDWSVDGGDLQIVFIAGNEPFNQGNVSYINACNQAKSKNIIVNTIFCGDFNEGVNTFWKRGADITGGSYMSIDQNTKTVFIDSPYDDKIAELNQKLNETYVEYGREGQIKKQKQSVQDKNAESYGKANTVKRAVSKSTHIYKNESWDLVDAAESGSVKPAAVPKSELPEEMKNMNDAEMEKYLKQKKAERAKIQQEILTLNQKREAYVAQKQKEKAQEKTLDNAMLKAIKSQASKKQFVF